MPSFITRLLNQLWLLFIPSNFHLADVGTQTHSEIIICLIISGDPPYMPEVSSATDTSNFDVDIESSKANVSASSLFEQAYELLWSPLFCQAGRPEFKLGFDLYPRS